MANLHLLATLPTEIGYSRAVLRGVTDYCQPRGIELTFAPTVFGPEEPLRGEPDAIVSFVADDPTLAVLRRWERPIVNVSSRRQPAWDAAVAHVLPDNRAVGARAARHLVERGHKHLAFCGIAMHWYSSERCAGADEVAAERGTELICFGLIERDTAAARLKRWLVKLPRPVGIVCANDQRGRLVLEMCHRAGIRVPDDCAVVGADNDEIYCRLANPPLTSVDINAERIGQRAAELAVELASGKPVPDRPILVPPRDVVVRRSSDTMAFTDAEIAEAMRFIHDHADRGIEVEDVLRQVAVSRRSLERRFLKLVGRTPYQEICRVRMERAKQLLAETNTPVAQIAGMLGFDHIQHLGMMFKRVTGVQPSAYRKLHRHA